MQANKTNKDIQKIKEELSLVSASLFNTLGGQESYSLRTKIGDIQNSLLHLQKENRDNGDSTIPFL